MSEPAKKKATYEDLYSVPENMIAEIIGGELIASPRPSTEHALASSYLGPGDRDCPEPSLACGVAGSD